MVMTILKIEDLQGRGLQVPISVKAKLKHMEIESSKELEVEEIERVLFVVCGLIEYKFYRGRREGDDVSRWAALDQAYEALQRDGIFLVIKVCGNPESENREIVAACKEQQECGDS
jgi:hypothetical protein